MAELNCKTEVDYRKEIDKEMLLIIIAGTQNASKSTCILKCFQVLIIKANPFH